MCGRFSLPVGDRDIAFEWDVELSKLGCKPRYNISPTQDVLAIREEPGKGLVAESMHWWFIPGFAKEPHKITAFNARDDRILDLNEKSMFRPAFKKRRCLIVAGGFYEWKKETVIEKVSKLKKKGDTYTEVVVDKKKQIKLPHYIFLKNRKVFGCAGIWQDWTSPQGETIRTCSIVTTSPNGLVKPIHDRMPVIIKKEFEEEWLDPQEREVEELEHILQPYPAEEMDLYRVGNVVNSSANDVPECIVAV